MELIEIIKSSLSIFSVFSFILISVSYTVYKIKDRNRIKPYMRVNIQSAGAELAIVNNSEFQRVEVKKEMLEFMNNKFRIVNEVRKVRPQLRRETAAFTSPSLPKNNIYDLYYFGKEEEMHKLKLASASR